MIHPRVEQIPALTGIRLLAAVGVVVGHFSGVMYGLFPGTRSASNLVQGGYLGVEMFFVLSGFIIAHNYADRFQTFSAPIYGRFLLNRFARLYPVHIVTLATVTVLVIIAALAEIQLNSEGKYDPTSFLMNVMLLQSVPPAWSWNGPAWSISAEAGAYILFPLLALALARVQNWKFALIAVAVLLFATVGALYAVAAVTDFSAISYPSMWIRIAGEFSAGCFLWKVWAATSTRGKKYDYLAIVSLCGIGAVLFTTPQDNVANFLALPLIAVFVFSCAAASGFVRRFLRLAQCSMEGGFLIAFIWSTSLY